MQKQMRTRGWLFAVLINSAMVTMACGSGAEGGSDGSDAAGSGGTTSIDLSTSSDGASTDGAGTDGSGTDAATSDGTTGSGTGAGGSDGSTTGVDASTDGTVLDPLELCGGTCECANGIDDDGDGKVDGFDEECTGIADNDEGTFATGIPGDNKDPKWQDCFFDGNSGAGDDGCRYHTDCLDDTLADDDASCTVTESCIDFCAQRTPNGCDCFGCCTFDTADGPLSVQIGITCDYENIEDEAACPRCVPSEQCGNECGECELCPGKDTLPETCDNDVPECDNGAQSCDLDNPCPGGYWCTQGCCIIQPIE